jgi:hypothetical protein
MWSNALAEVLDNKQRQIEPKFAREERTDDRAHLEGMDGPGECRNL